MVGVDYVAANRLAWNDAAPKHAESQYQKLLDSFAQPGYSYLAPFEQERLLTLGIEGKAIAQLCCNNGRELLSLKNLGAGRCVGFDLSEGFIEQARGLACAGGIACEFVGCNVYEIPADYDGAFDLVYITIGAMCWLEDLTACFAVVARLLRPGGQVFVYEMHPFLDMLEFDKNDPLHICHSYFKDDPFVDTSGLDYWTDSTYESAPCYSFHHKLSDIFGAVLGNGLAIRAFDEYAHDISNVFAHLEPLAIKPPLCYILLGHKQ